MTEKNTTNGRLMAKNTLAMYVRTAIVMVVSLYVTRALLIALGESDYGIYNIVGSVVVFFTFLNSSITQAIQRFLTFELGKGDVAGTKKVFRSSLSIQVLVVVFLIILCETVGLWFLKARLNIPAERADTAFWVFQFSIISFSIGILRAPFEAAVIAYEKLSFFAYASIFDSLIRLGIVFCLLRSNCDRLFEYGALVAVEAVLMFALYAVFSKKNFEICSFKPGYDKACFKQMSSYFGWNLLGNATNVATQQGFTFFLNIFFGVAVNAAMGIANQVIAAVTAFVTGFQTAFRPQIVKAYSQQDLPRVGKLVFTTSRISFILIFLPALIIIINAPLILDIWLKDVPQYTVSFCRLILTCCILDGISGPFNCAIMACSRIRNYQIAISCVFLADLVLSFVLFKAGIQPQYILYSRLATRGVINLFVGLKFMAKQLDFNVPGYLKKVLVPITIYSLIIALASLAIMRTAAGWQLFWLSTAFVLIPGGVLAYAVLLSEEERALASTFIKNRFSRQR